MSAQQLGYNWFPNKAQTIIHVLDEIHASYWIAKCGCVLESTLTNPLNDKKHEPLRCLPCLWTLRKRHNL